MKKHTMTSYKHTPGPWTKEYCGKDRIKIFKPSDNRRIATINVKHMIMDEANARIMAAGPDMLEALYHGASSEHHTHCESRKGHPHECTCHVGKAKKAIAKAIEG